MVYATMTGLGTLQNPWDLVTAFASAEISGSNAIARYLNVLEGTSTDADKAISLAGVFDRRITIRPLDLASPSINGGLTCNGSYYTLRDIEIFWDGWTSRVSQQSESDPTDLTRKNLGGSGTYLKLVNCIIHDLGSPFFGSAMLGLEIYGCILYHNGWSAPDRGHGHGLYIQNDTPSKVIKDCIIFDNFGYGIHAYTEGGKIDNIILDGCVCFEAGSLYGTNYNNILVGGLQVAQNPIIRSCMTYGASGVNIGYVAGADNVSLENNYFPDGIAKVNITNLTETGNTYGMVGNRVFLRPNVYDPNRANLVIYNEVAANTINVDVSAIFGASGTVKARNVQDYFIDIQNLTITAGVITVNMQAVNRTVATPIGWTAPATTYPQFGCMVLEKVL